MRNYPELDRGDDALMGELCSRTIEEDQEIGKMLKTTAERSWRKRVMDAERRIWHSFIGANKADLGAYSGLTPKAAVRKMVADGCEHLPKWQEAARTQRRLEPLCASCDSRPNPPAIPKKFADRWKTILLAPYTE